MVNKALFDIDIFELNNLYLHIILIKQHFYYYIILMPIYDETWEQSGIALRYLVNIQITC